MIQKFKIKICEVEAIQYKEDNVLMNSQIPMIHSYPGNSTLATKMENPL